MAAVVPLPLSVPRYIDTLRNRLVLLAKASGVVVSGDMGTFRIDIEIENPMRPGKNPG